MALDQSLELRDGVRVAAELELGIDPLLERVEPLLLEAADLVLGERLGRELDERGPPPAGERLAQLRRTLLRLPSSRLRDEPLEALEVEPSGLHMDHIAGGLPLEHVRAEQPADRVHLVLQRCARRARRLLTPELVDQVVLRHRLVSVQQQQAEERALLGGRDGDDLAIASHLERPEDAELEYDTQVTLAPCRARIERPRGVERR